MTMTDDAEGLAEQIYAGLAEAGRTDRRGWFLRRRNIRSTIERQGQPSGDQVQSVAKIRLVVQEDSDSPDGGEVRTFQINVIELKGAV